MDVKLITLLRTQVQAERHLRLQADDRRVRAEELLSAAESRQDEAQQRLAALEEQQPALLFRYALAGAVGGASAVGLLWWSF